MIINNNELALILHNSVKRETVREYAMNRLKISLHDINISSDCISDILKIITDIYNAVEFNACMLNGFVTAFRKKWSLHLSNAYFINYEKIRWKYIEEIVLKEVKENAIGRCLDIGCGRGCITESLISFGYANSAIGIDDVKTFEMEWKERICDSELNEVGQLGFDHVNVQNIGNWLNINALSKRFDTVFLFYVLHHSNDYWVNRTLKAIMNYIKKDGYIIVLEDSLIRDKEPKYDSLKLCKKWVDWLGNDSIYNLSIGYDIQVLLDFVAVQLLAGFSDVPMPCNYKLGSEWEELFKNIGLKIEKSVNIGFPHNRDIDVPQSLFVLRND